MSENTDKNYNRVSNDNVNSLLKKYFSRENVIYLLAILLSISHLYFNLFSTLPDDYISAIHFGGYGSLVILMMPLWKKHHAMRYLGSGLDFLLILGLVFSVFYFLLFSDALAIRGYDFIASDWFASILAIAISLELVRRCIGWIVPGLICLGLSYVLFLGAYIDGMFHFPGLSAETILFRNYFDDGLFGSISKISWSFVFMFILFGSFLVRAGTGDFILRLATVSVGRYTGGPGLVAVVGSGLMGSVSGSAIANTAATGVITIPMMKKAGFPPIFAAAVEAGASTGGQLIPPVMGAGVFIMSSYTQIPYLTIVSVAFLPAILYFLSIAIFVRIQAKRLGLKPVSNTDSSMLEELKHGWYHLLPLVILLALMGYGFTPTYAAGFATMSIWLFSVFSDEPMGFKGLWEALADGSKSCAITAVLLVAIGVMVNCIAISSLGVTFSFMINEWAGSNLLLMLSLVALASLIIGTGLPVTASYIVLATLSAPAIYDLIAQHAMVEAIMDGTVSESAKSIIMMLQPGLFDIVTTPQAWSQDQIFTVLSAMPADARTLILENAIDPARLSMMLLSAHMIIFWLSQDSNVTPPVCLVAFTAASIAKTPPMATGVEAWKTAKALYIIPVLFAYTNFIGGSLLEVLGIFVVALAGMYALVAAIYGFSERQLGIRARLFMAVVGTVLIWPTLPYYIHMLAALGLLLLLAKQILEQKNIDPRGDGRNEGLTKSADGEPASNKNMLFVGDASSS